MEAPLTTAQGRRIPNSRLIDFLVSTGNGLLAPGSYGCRVVDLFTGHRANAALDGRPPETIAEEGGVRAGLGSYRWQSHCRGLYHTPIAA